MRAPRVVVKLGDWVTLNGSEEDGGGMSPQPPLPERACLRAFPVFKQDLQLSLPVNCCFFPFSSSLASAGSIDWSVVGSASLIYALYENQIENRIFTF
jgi:hypothetical protein